MSKVALLALEIAQKDVADKVREVPRFSNRGPRVSVYLETAGVPLGQPYCCSGVFTWLHEACLKLHTPNPMIKTGYCPTAVNDFKKRGLIRSKNTDADPGDLIFYWMKDEKGLYRFSHTGMIEKNNGDGTLLVLECNTNNDGSRDGDGVYRKLRRVSGTKHAVINLQGFETLDQVVPVPMIKPLPVPVPTVSLKLTSGIIPVKIDGKQAAIESTIVHNRAFISISDLIIATNGRKLLNAEYIKGILEIKTS